MGASVSKNISSSVTKAIAKVSSEIIQKTELSQDQSQIISVRNVHGNVHVSRNKFIQKATVNMKSLLDALSKEENQQKILMELTQHAKSITSGLNLGQYANAQNVMNTLIEATVNLLTTINQTCAAFTKQFQEINIKRVYGDVYVNDNVFDEIYNVLQNCSEQAIADSESIQDLTNKLSQSASATSEGLSGWAIVALIAIILGTPVIGVAISGLVFLKFIFPIILIIGSILLVLYYMNVNAKQKMNLVGFSSFIKKTPSCFATPLDEVNLLGQNLTAIEASNACLKNANCKAFDWKGLNVSNNGKFIESLPVTNFYSSVSNDCIKNIPPDHTILLRTPDAFQGTIEPNEILGSRKGDIYLNTNNGTWYQKVIGWEPMGVMTNVKFNKITWGSIDPMKTNLLSSPTKDDVYVYRNISNPLYFYVYRFSVNGASKGVWQLEHKIRGPGLISATPSVINTSGFKQLKSPEWMLYSGLICTIVGFVGTTVTFYFNK
jgi:hypothetical protein